MSPNFEMERHDEGPTQHGTGKEPKERTQHNDSTWFCKPTIYKTCNRSAMFTHEQQQIFDDILNKKTK